MHGSRNRNGLPITPENGTHRASGGLAEADADVPAIAVTIAMHDFTPSRGRAGRFESETDHRALRHLFVGTGFENVLTDRKIHQRLHGTESITVEVEDGRPTRQGPRGGGEQGG